MSKRKTKQQKIIAKLRKELLFTNQKTLDHQKETQKSPTQKQEEPKNNQQRLTYNFLPVSQKNIPQQNYSFLKHDLLKTILVTGSIIAIELLLFFLIQSHLLPISL
ncbi:hypothetical protein C4559_05875 [Candidatus Microgenomates bacterium]|nr:MAG: hypothetical protein C4559_05875 [Candidatus Microgenomates bacterium]